MFPQPFKARVDLDSQCRDGSCAGRASYGCPSTHQPTPEETDLLLKQKLQRWFSGQRGLKRKKFPMEKMGGWVNTMFFVFLVHFDSLRNFLCSMAASWMRRRCQIPEWSCPGTRPCNSMSCFLLFDQIADTCSSWMKCWNFQCYFQCFAQFMFQ